MMLKKMRRTGPMMDWYMSMEMKTAYAKYLRNLRLT
jgi:hypothetical protein